MIVVVTGGRDHDVTADEAARFAFLMPGVSELRHGGARGVDRWAADRAHQLGVIVVEWPADWQRNGPGAGPVRNLAMLLGPPRADMLIAFPGGLGTANCVRTAHRLGIEVQMVGAP